MKIRSLLLGLAAVAALLVPIAVNAQAITLPQIQKIGPTDLFQDIVGGVPNAQSQYASSLGLGGFFLSQATKLNALIGGDAEMNLFQRGTTGASVTGTITYGGPDRWAYWSGTNTAMTVSKDTTAADLPANAYAAGFKMARTSGQTGVVPVCMTQEVETVNSVMFQGTTAELDFYATAGSNFSAASNALTAYIVTGTGTDQGVSTMAFAFNAGGGGSSTWTGQATTVADTATISTTPTRFAAVGVIPAGTTEMAVIFCYTPVGTAGTNDYVALSGIQLTRNASLSSIAASTTAMDCSTISCSSFDRRLYGLEALMQYRYYYRIVDAAANTVPVTLCQATTTAAVVCPIQFPVPMRAAPTATASATTAFSDTATAGAPTACTAFAVVASSTSATNGKVTCTAGATTTAGGSSQLVGAATNAYVEFSAEL